VAAAVAVVVDTEKTGAMVVAVVEVVVVAVAAGGGEEEGLLVQGEAHPLPARYRSRRDMLNIVCGISGLSNLLGLAPWRQK
jgi:hypothetical protein